MTEIPLTFEAASRANRVRCERWHPGFPHDGWTGADWSNAMAGEAGETCNVVKKLRRDDFGKQQADAPPRDELLQKLATEIGDTFLYLDLLAQHYGLDLARCVADTFNRVSVREGFPDRIPQEMTSAPVWSLPVEPRGVLAVKDPRGHTWVRAHDHGDALWWHEKVERGIGYEWHELLRIGPLTAASAGEAVD